MSDPLQFDFGMNSFYSTSKKITWIVHFKFKLHYGDEEEFVCAGFSLDGAGLNVDGGGLIMSCAHAIRTVQDYNRNATEITVRRLDQNLITYNAQVIYQKTEWDVLLLEVGGLTSNAFGNFVDSGNLYAGQPIYIIGGFLDFVASFISGQIAFPCYDEATLPPDGSKTCEQIRPNSWINPTYYRLMGDLIDKDFRLKQKLHSSLPIIQIKGFSSMGGSPIFNLNGDIVGMVLDSWGLNVIGLHVNVLKQAVQELRDRMT